MCGCKCLSMQVDRDIGNKRSLCQALIPAAIQRIPHARRWLGHRGGLWPREPGLNGLRRPSLCWWQV